MHIAVQGKPVSQWHRLEEHLKGTAELAKSFADEFGCVGGTIWRG
jgi:hypothetical protein